VITEYGVAYLHGKSIRERAQALIEVAHPKFREELYEYCEKTKWLQRAAPMVCRHFGSTLHIAHVISEAGLLLMTGGVDYVSIATIYEDAHTEAKEKIEQLAACLERIPHRTYLRHGPIWKNLSSIIEESKIDLIVVGTHGRAGFGKLLLGSVAEDILRHASCPVLTGGPKVNLAKIPDELTDEQVVLLADIASTGISAAESAELKIGDTAAVFARGPICLCATAGAKLKGASLIIALESDPVRAEMAKRMGADVVLDFTKNDVVEEIKG